ncbi:MAG: hypothetical protein J7L25_11325 [Deltaproteobacteria bacterium]|nr:hypothetical protein [Candidatus Tharpella aukensis]
MAIRLSPDNFLTPSSKPERSDFSKPCFTGWNYPAIAPSVLVVILLKEKKDPV